MIRKITGFALTLAIIFSITSGVFAAEIAIRPDTSGPESIIISNQKFETGAITFDYTSDKLEVGDNIMVMFYKPVGPEDGVKDCIIYKADGELTIDDLSNIYFIDQFEVKTDRKVEFSLSDDIEEGTYNLRVGGTGIYSPTVATVEVEKSFVMGDVNGDDVVNTKDRTVLSRYLAKWNDIIINEKASDVNNDGTVSVTDYIILGRYLAKWVGYNTLPYLK